MLKLIAKDKEMPKAEFQTYLQEYKVRLRELFGNEENLKHISAKRGFPPGFLEEVLNCKPLSAFIPERHNGRGGKVAECLSVLEASSYESLPLSLLVGINGALFLQPLSRYGEQELQEKIFKSFVEDNALGGLMITEPEYGSDALRMQTSYQEMENSYRIQGTKHWAGLTGLADFWILTAREKNSEDELGRDIGFFIFDNSEPGLEVEELFDNLGLYMLPYGRNKIDVTVPRQNKLIPKSTGVKMMLDILHRSRIEFPGMSMGFLRRILDETIQHCKTRSVGGKSLINYDQVKSRLTRLQAAFTTCSAMCAYSSIKANIQNDLSKADIPANSIKSVITDIMQDAAQSFLQLMGAQGYRMDHLAGRALIDSRPFQIFEGSNDILYHQIADSVLKSMRKMKSGNLYHFLNQYELASRASRYLEKSLNFEVDFNSAQRKMVELGKALGRIVSMEMVIELGENGFRGDLINNCLETLQNDINKILSGYRQHDSSDVVEEYTEDSSWLNYISVSV